MCKVMENVSECMCVCKSVVRKSFDKQRGCYKYTATFVPKGTESGNIFDDSDLFAKEYLIPLRDSAVRTNNPTIQAPVVTSVNGQDIDPTQDVLTAWDKVVASAFVGKEHIVYTITRDVKDLTDGKFDSYELDLGGEPILVSSRTISCLNRPEEALARLRNQVLRACTKANEEQA